MSEFDPTLSTPAMTELMNYITTAADETNGLYSIIERDPQVLDDFDKIPFVQTPSHAAAASGRTRLAIETLNLMPSFGRKLNPQGLTPLHVAVTGRQHMTALVIVRFDRGLVRVKGKDGNTPLHLAAAYCVEGSGGDLDVLANFLMECPDAMNELNNRYQSAVHLVMASHTSDAVRLVLNWVVWMGKETVLGWKDDDGNTPLHIAAQHGCQEGLKTMVNAAKINKRNSEMETPLDVALHYRNEAMANILRNGGAKKASDLRRRATAADYLRSPTSTLESSLRTFCFMVKDLTLDMRNVVLVVAVLIATATYQAVLQPPGGVSSQDDGAAAANSTAAGKMVMEKKAYDQFVPATTTAFTLSVVMIIFVLHGRPYNLILHGCLLFLAFSYLAALKSISPAEDGAAVEVTFVLSWCTIVAAFAVKMMYYLIKALFEDVWWLPSCPVVMSNFCNRVAGRTTQEGISYFKKLRKMFKLILSSGK